MKNYHLVTALAPVLSATICLSVASLQAAPAPQSQKHGTDILHLSIAERMVNVAAATFPDAAGSVVLRHHEQGKVTVQSLDITAQKLAAGSSYTVLATLADGSRTNVGELVTDTEGRAKLRFRKIAHSNGKINRLGRGHSALPDALSDLESLRKLSIASEVAPPTEPPTYSEILSADLSQPGQFQYLVKRDLSTESIRATLQIGAHSHKARLRLSARGLSANTPYWLAVNTYAVPEFTVIKEVADARGRLEMRTDVEPVARVLDLHEVQLWASDTAPVTPELPVLSTVLPAP